MLLAVVLSVTSCTTARFVSSQPRYQSEWVGKSHADIVRTFGAPTREVSDGDNGLILVYESFYSTYDSDEFMGDYTTTVKEHRNFKEFYLDPDGNCYNVRTNESFINGRKFDLLSTGWLGIAAAIATIGLIMTH